MLVPILPFAVIGLLVTGTAGSRDARYQGDSWQNNWQGSGSFGGALPSIDLARSSAGRFSGSGGLGRSGGFGNPSKGWNGSFGPQLRSRSAKKYPGNGAWGLGGYNSLSGYGGNSYNSDSGWERNTGNNYNGWDSGFGSSGRWDQSNFRSNSGWKTTGW